MSIFSQKGNHQQSGRKGSFQTENIDEAFSERMEENLGHSPEKKNRRIKNVILIIAGALVLLVLLGVIAVSIWTKAPDTEEATLKVQVTPSPTAAPTSSATPTPTFTPEPTEKPLRKENVYTLLVVGRDQVGMNTDTIMVVQMDCENHTANVVSIPRDTLVNVPWSIKKVNSIYGAYGAEGLVDGIEDILGFEVDNYVIVNVFIFRDIIDAIGGIYFDVPMYMYYDDPEQYLHISLSPGYQLLDGYHSEMFVRFRQNNDGSGYPGGDLDRIDAQHAFFTEVVKQTLKLGNIAQLPDIIDMVIENTDTDLTSGNLAFYAQEFLKMKSEDIRFLTLPYQNANILGGSYVSILLYEWLDMVNEYLSPFNIEVTTENMDILTYDGYGFSSTTGSAPGYESFYDYNAILE